LVGQYRGQYTKCDAKGNTNQNQRRTEGNSLFIMNEYPAIACCCEKQIDQEGTARKPLSVFIAADKVPVRHRQQVSTGRDDQCHRPQAVAFAAGGVAFQKYADCQHCKGQEMKLL